MAILGLVKVPDIIKVPSEEVIKVIKGEEVIKNRKHIQLSQINKVRKAKAKAKTKDKVNLTLIKDNSPEIINEILVSLS